MARSSDVGCPFHMRRALDGVSFVCAACVPLFKIGCEAFTHSAFGFLCCVVCLIVIVQRCFFVAGDLSGPLAVVQFMWVGSV